MTGYAVQPIQTVVTSAVHIVLAPVATWLPFAALLLVLSGVSGLTSTFLRHRLQDTERLEAVQTRLEELQEQMKEAQESADDWQDEQAELLQAWTAMMKMQFRPAVWSMLLTIPVFLWIRWVVHAPALAIAPVTFSLPLVGPVVWTATVVGPLKVWVVWYLGGTLISTQLSKRLYERLVA
ncbi:DUF106 domain-containing protein [Halogeometricum borinquense]|uniref:DUF106 domain-containing protein n=1 Tax=Halogeometricum borinquense TaxID=60847 RepID=UPI00342A6768